MSDGATPVIALAGVRVAHGARAVLDVPALAVPAGETLGVMGPNGAGKSTLLRVLGLLEAPTAGTVRFRGEAVTPAQGLAVRRRMASVFQEPLLADATVFDNAAMGLHFRGVTRARARPRVGAWLERFGIAALDQPTRETLIQDLRGVLRADRVTTVLVTHHRGEALALGDRLAVLIGGHILQVGPAAQVFQAPDSEDVARFVGLETILAGRVRGRRDGRILVEADGHALEVAAAGEPGEWVQLALRPEDLRRQLPGRPCRSRRARPAARARRGGLRNTGGGGRHAPDRRRPGPRPRPAGDGVVRAGGAPRASTLRRAPSRRAES